MNKVERDVLKVDVPVGFLLTEQRELLVSVDRAADTPLTIRLRLIPAEVEGMTDLGAMPHRSSHDTPMPSRYLFRRLRAEEMVDHEYGGGD